MEFPSRDRPRSATINDLEMFKEYIHYDEASGKCTWKKVNGTKTKVGALVGGRVNGGYLRVKLNNICLLLHRFAWAVTNGWPDKQIDHINGDPADNRIENLRLCSSAENSQNRNLSKNNKTGYTGVSYLEKDKVFTAQICVDWRLRFLGRFQTVEEAAIAYAKAKEKLHKFNPKVRAKQ